jgi:predicted transcriptional regulator
MTDRSQPDTGVLDGRPDEPSERLDERKAAILRAIVEQYVDSAQPVGSQTITQTTELGVSAATVRNEMSVLEREGYITQPHTSAGRIPTDRGYRYFVDHLAGAGLLPASERRRIAEFFTTATLAMDELLFETSQLLARVTTHAAVVVGPQTDAVVVRGVSLVMLQPRILLLVIVLSNGAVEKETLVFDDDLDETDIAVAGARLVQRLGGRRLADVSTAIIESPDDERRSSHRAARTPCGPRDPRARAAWPRSHGSDRVRERAPRPARVLARARAVPGRGRARGDRRRSRPDQNGLPKGPSSGRDGVASARTATFAMRA